MKRAPLDENTHYYWLSQENNNEIISKGFIRQELFALQNQFI